MSVSSTLFTLMVFNLFVGVGFGYWFGKRVGFTLGKRQTLEDEHGCN